MRVNFNCCAYTVSNVDVGIRVSTGEIGSYFLEHRLEDGRFETSQFVVFQNDVGSVVVTVSFKYTQQQSPSIG